MIKAILDLNVASVLRRIGQGDCPTEPALSVETLENMVQDLVRASPDPVPATNQAGEVERLRAALADAVEVLEHVETDGTDFDISVATTIEKGHATLATQPATSQEGEATLCQMAARASEWRLVPPEPTRAICEAIEAAMARGRTDHAWIDALAATPTPPTLSDDLRALVAGIVSPAAMKTMETIRSEWTEWMADQVFGDGPHKIDKEKATERLIQDKWEELEPKRLRALKKADAILAALAHAQVQP